MGGGDAGSPPGLGNFTPEQIYNKTIDSIVVVRTSNGKGGKIAVQTHDGEGSGVVVGDNLVATNCHVVDNGGRITVMSANAGHSGASVNAEIVASSDCDLCLLKTQGLSVSPVEIGKAGNLKVGHPVYAIGVPRSLGGTLSNGIVSRLWNLSDSHALPGPLIQTNAFISYGSSGGGLFDANGRLVGITTFGEGGLNFAIPAEMIGQLQGRIDKEREIRQMLDSFDELSADDFPYLAREITGSFDDLNVVSGLWHNMGVYSAICGEFGWARQIAEHIAKILESKDWDSSDRDFLLAGAAGVWSCVGTDHVSKAVELIGKIGNPMQQAIGYADITSNCARHEKPPFEKGKAVRALIWSVPGFKEIFNPESLGFPNLIGALIKANAEVYDSEVALQLADKHIDEMENAEHFLLYVNSLAEIAAALKRQEVTIGASAIFHYALHAATSFRSRGVGTPERLVALGHIAVNGAECGNDVSGAFNRMRHILEKGAVSDISEDRMPGISYRRKIEARGLEAVARAITGDIIENMRTPECIKCIPVLEHLPAALVCHACKLQRQEAKRRENAEK